jgi:hypothetical protein
MKVGACGLEDVSGSLGMHKLASLLKAVNSNILALLGPGYPGGIRCVQCEAVS